MKIDAKKGSNSDEGKLWLLVSLPITLTSTVEILPQPIICVR